MEYERRGFVDLKKSNDKELILSVLWDVGKMIEDNAVYTLNPEVLEFDERGNAYFNSTDEEAKSVQCDFIAEYKALIGSMLQSKYRFVDYIEGGLSLLKKDKVLNEVYLAESVDEIRAILHKEHVDRIYDRKKNKKDIRKSNYVLLMVATIILFISTTLLSVYFIQDFYFKDKRTAAIVAAFEAYQSKDYIGVIDSLSFVDNSYMNSKEKCILAVSYIRSENLNDEQKENILNDLNILNIEKLYDYWIYLGRNKFADSQNIAMQLSDNELLLYSYMKEREFLLNNTNVDGQEKTDRISELENYIQGYKKEYDSKVESATSFDMN